MNSGIKYLFGEKFGHKKYILVGDVRNGDDCRNVLSNTISTNGLEIIFHAIDRTHSKHAKSSEGSLKLKKVASEFYLPMVHHIMDEAVRPTKFLGMDLGKTCIVGCSTIGEEIGKRNLAVKTKAVNQPCIKFRRFIEMQKKDRLDVIEKEQESPYPVEKKEPLKEYYARYFKRYEVLAKFYNTHQMKKKAWEAKKRLLAEYDKLTNAIIRMVNGRMHVKVEDPDDVMICVGVAKFSTDGSHHLAFLRHLYSRLTPLGYKVVGVGEKFTSQRCPCCTSQVEDQGDRGYRVKYCRRCNKHFHRDAMAAQNQAIAAKSMVEEGKWPEYLERDWDPKQLEGSASAGTHH